MQPTKKLRKKSISIEGNEDWLDKLQAGILKGNGRDHILLLFLKFKKSAIKEVKEILADLPITSALEQEFQITKKLKSKVVNQTITNFYLTNKGYQSIKVKIKTKEKAFKQGLANRKEENVHILGDRSETWDQPFQKEIHGILSIANDDLAILKSEITHYKAEFKDKIKILHIEFGKVYKNENNQPIEHFGYADGISQPLFFKKDIAKKKTKYWNPEAGLDLVLVKDIGTKEEDCFGSFMVFRKLEQNVKAFKDAEHELAKELKLVGSAEEAAGALIIGRFENGLPVIKYGSTNSPEIHSTDNNFNFSLDKKGLRCPFHAHIRKTNPRGDNKRFFGISEKEEKSHRIVRRGITYGERKLDKENYIIESAQPTEGVGLLFICFQRSIEHQFEFMQRTWVNNNDFPIPFTGIDPIIGQGENRKTNKATIEQQWKTATGESHLKSLASFVTMKGGEYFFAPSLPFFKNLSKHSNPV